MRTFRLSIDEDTLTDELFAFVCDPRSTRYQRPVVKELRVIAPGMIPVMEMMILDGVQERRYVYDSSTSRAPSGPRCRCSRTRTASGPDEEIPETLAGVPAPPGRDILVENGRPVLDGFGNVLGGLRSPYLDVSTSTWFASSTGASFCFIARHEVPFDQATLDELYPSRGAYVSAVASDVHELVLDRYITRADGQELTRAAVQTDIRGAGDSTAPR